MLPQGVVATVTALQAQRCFQRCLLIRRIFFGLATGCGIDFFQLGYGKGSLLRIFPGKAFIKIRQLGLARF